MTPPGSLGTIPQGTFYEVPLIAYEPDNQDQVFYQVVSGELPAGVACGTDGVIAGVPDSTVLGNNEVSKFAVRAYTKRYFNGTYIVNRLADRTFTLTVAGQSAPKFITPAGLVAQYFDGTLIPRPGLQILFTDYEIATIRLLSGELPLGTSINNKGLITGFIYPSSFTPSESDPFPPKTVYEFTLEVTNNVSSDIRRFSIDIYSENSLTADNTYITADNTFITADGSPFTPPTMITSPGSIGITYDDSFFAFQFQAIDIEGVQIEYTLLDIDFLAGYGIIYDVFGYSPSPEPLPTELTLDPNTGWLYGYLPDLNFTQQTFYFSVMASVVGDPSINTGPIPYSLTIIGNIDSQLVWVSSTNLGLIDNGATSTFSVKAIPRSQQTIQYRLKSGSYSLLPQGLTLLPSGEIAGRVSFNVFGLDNGTTIFDDDTTTFDLDFRFMVNAYSDDGVIDDDKEFVIRVVRRYKEPYENLYIEAMPPLDDRQVIYDLLSDTNIFPENLLYRPDDPNFGLATSVKYWHAFGLTSATREDYVNSLWLNHYWKNLTLGQIKTAQARDDEGNVIYEVVYSEVIDNLINNEGVTVDKAVVLPYPITLADFDRRADTTVITADNTLVTADCAPFIDPLTPNTPNTLVVFPNGLADMRIQVVDSVGQVSRILPRWMLSKQSDGRILGFTPAWVIAYTQPGESGRVAYNIQTQFKGKLNEIDFEADRYELDHALSLHWDPYIKQWVPPASETDFDEGGWSLPINYLRDVDYATELAFVDINQCSIDYINSLGGIDGPVDSTFNGKTLIFVRQEEYVNPRVAHQPGVLTEDEAWTYWVDPYDTTPYSADGDLYDESYVVPGQLAHDKDPLIPNERMAIWQITIQSDNFVKLTLLKLTNTYDSVTVVNGEEYAGDTLYVPSCPVGGYMFINWQPIPTFTTTPTVFDHDSLKFIDPSDEYIAVSNEYDQYLVWPKRNILYTT